MSPSVARLTLFALISAVEEDLRRLMLLHLGHLDPPRVLPPEILRNAADRLAGEGARGHAPPSLRELAPYLDFADAYKVLNAPGAHLPAPLSAHLRPLTESLDAIAPVRNRVMHGRPLEGRPLRGPCRQQGTALGFRWRCAGPAQG